MFSEVRKENTSVYEFKLERRQDLSQDFTVNLSVTNKTF